MKKVKRLFVILAVLLVLVSGAVTVYAVSDDSASASFPAASVEDYAAEEMAVGAYYESWTPEAA